MRVKLVDPSAFTPPYDRSLAAALASRGVEVELLTSRFLHGPVPEADGFRVEEAFYRRTGQRGRDAVLRLPFKAGEHLLDLARFSRTVGTDQDLVHYQWLTWPALDRHFLPPFRPRVMTAHHVPPPGRELSALASLLGSMDATIVHTRAGREALVAAGLGADRVEVVPHGAFDYLTRVAPEPLPEPLDRTPPERPVVLFFGLVRPYKGLDVLIEAMGSVPEAELWVVGNPRMDQRELAGLRELSAALPGGSAWVTRFVGEGEARAVLERADVLVLPYRRADQSGVLYLGLAFGKAMVVTEVGGPGEFAADTGAVESVPAGDAAALASVIAGLVADPGRRSQLAGLAAAEAGGEYSWDRVADRTISVYREAIARSGS